MTFVKVMRLSWSSNFCAALIAGFALMMPVAASAQQPTAAAVATAEQILDVRGSMAIFESLIPGVIEQAKSVFLQTNPNLAGDLNEVAANLRKELALRQMDLRAEAAKIYASRFSEQELKDALAFYKSPLGQKLLTEEPVIVERTLQMAQEWAGKLSEEVMVKFRAEMKQKGHTL